MLPRFLVVSLAVLLTLSARAQAPAPASVESRLAALEQQLQTLTRENEELRRRLDVPAGPSVVVKPAGKETSVAIGGFLQGQAEFGGASDPRWSGVRDRFFFRRARLHVAGAFAEHFDFKAELDFQGNTLGASTGNTARANEIFVNWSKWDAMNVRFGQLKPAFGAEALASDTKCYTIERSLANDRLTDGRQLALGFAGSWLDKRLSYYAVLANGNGANVSANDNSKFQRSARLAWTPQLSKQAGKLTLGVDGLWATDAGISKVDFGFPANSFMGERAMWGLDAAWSLGRLELNGEYLHGRFDRLGASGSQESDGWQATAAFFVVPAKLQFVLRREGFDPNTSLGGNTYSTSTLGLNIFLKGDDIKFMVDLLAGRGPHAAGEQERIVSRVQVAF